MAGKEEEKSSFGKFVKKQTGYGSTTKSLNSHETCITHTLNQGETLQGLALQYGVSTENIRRVNKLWTNDSLFLRDTLQIPISKKPNDSNSVIFSGNNDINIGASTSTAEDSTLTDNGESDSAQTKVVKSKSEHSSLNLNLDGDKSSHMSGASAADLDANDFLSRFDSSLAGMKSNVKKMMCNTSFAEDDMSNPLTLLDKKKKKYGLKHRAKTLDDVDIDPRKSPELQIKSPSNSRTLRNSCNQMEQKDDEMFQL